MLSNYRITISFVIILCLALISINSYANNKNKKETNVTGYLIIKKNEKSFDNGIVVISLYKIERGLADKSADLAAKKNSKKF